MPWPNYAFPDCHVTRTVSMKELSHFKFQPGKANVIVNGEKIY